MDEVKAIVAALIFDVLSDTDSRGRLVATGFHIRHFNWYHNPVVIGKIS